MQKVQENPRWLTRIGNSEMTQQVTPQFQAVIKSDSLKNNKTQDLDFQRK